VDPDRDEQLTALVGHAEHCGIDFEQVDHRVDDGVKRRIEGQALRERARDLVERPQLARALPLERKDVFELRPVPRRLLVQLRVLECDGQPSGERG